MCCSCLHTDAQTHRHIDTQTHRHTDTQTHRHTDTQTHRHTDTQTHRHTDKQTHRHTHTQTHRIRTRPSARAIAVSEEVLAAVAGDSAYVAGAVVSADTAAGVSAEHSLHLLRGFLCTHLELPVTG